MGRSTSRLLQLPCPMCGVALQIHVRGLAHDVDPDAWLDALPIDAREYIHAEHVRVGSSVVDGSRTRTRPLIG